MCVHSYIVRLIWLTIGCGAFVAHPAFAGEYRDTAGKFKLQLPDAWAEIPAGAIDTVNANLQQRMPGSTVRYQTGFQIKNRPTLSYPYILVQPQSFPTGMKTPTLDQIEAELAKETKGAIKQVEGALADVAKNMAVGEIVMDRATSRFVMRTELDVTGIGKVKGFSTGHVGTRGIILVHCYARAPEFDRYFPTFQAINASFQYEPGQEFKPQVSSVASPAPQVKATSMIGWVAGLMVGFVCIGFVVAAAAVGGVIWLVKSRKPTA